MEELKTNYKDDVLDTSKNTRRKYNMIQNPDGTVSFEDVTQYSQQGDEYGAKEVNELTSAVNELNSNSEKNVKHLKSLIDGKLQFYQVKANNIDRIESSEFPSTYCIGMGALDDGTAVVSFHCSWIDIQIKANANNIYMRLHYGSNGWKGWKQIANFQ